jgi:hypothetical protein
MQSWHLEPHMLQAQWSGSRLPCFAFLFVSITTNVQRTNAIGDMNHPDPMHKRWT